MNQNGEKATSKNGDNASLYFQGLKNCFRNYYVAHAFVVCSDYHSVCDVFEIYNGYPASLFNNNVEKVSIHSGEKILGLV